MIRRSKKVLTADFLPKKVIFNTETYAPHLLNSAASLIWDFCETPKDEGEVMEYLRRTYGISASRAKKDITKFIKELRRKGIIEIYERKS